MTNPAHTLATTFYNQYHSVMGDLLDRHIPVSTKFCSSLKPQPWMNDCIQQANQIKRRRESVWCRTRSPNDRHVIFKLTATTVSCLRPKTIGTPKLTLIIKINPEIYGIVSINHFFQVSGKSPSQLLPSDFGTYFNEKIQKIRAIL